MSLNSKPPEEIEWYLDYQLGGRTVADMLRANGLTVHIQTELVPQDATDEEWLSVVGERGYVVLTKDRMIQRRDVEREALIQANVRAFVLIAKETNGLQNAQIFLTAYPAMLAYIKRHPAPFIVRVYRDGSLKPIDLEKVASDRRRRRTRGQP